MASLHWAQLRVQKVQAEATESGDVIWHGGSCAHCRSVQSTRLLLNIQAQLGEHSHAPPPDPPFSSRTEPPKNMDAQAESLIANRFCSCGIGYLHYCVYLLLFILSYVIVLVV